MKRTVFFALFFGAVFFAAASGNAQSFDDFFGSPLNSAGQGAKPFTFPPDLVGSALESVSQMDSAIESLDNEGLSAMDDYYLGRGIAAEIFESYKAYTKNPALTVYLNEICMALIVNSPRPSLYNGYHVVILDTQEINGLATPGGHIFISLGLIGCAGSEDELAAILAHEIAHIQLRHAADIIKNERMVQDLTAIGERGAAIASAQARTQVFGRGITAGINALMHNGYAHEQEYEADQEAVILLRDAGYDPSAITSLLRTVAQVQPAFSGGWASTHPSPELRIARLSGVVQTGNGRQTRPLRKERYEKLGLHSH